MRNQTLTITHQNIREGNPIKSAIVRRYMEENGGPPPHACYCASSSAFVQNERGGPWVRIRYPEEFATLQHKIDQALVKIADDVGEIIGTVQVHDA